MRGEYINTNGHASGTGELPPHARRILFENTIIDIMQGTTSACAENTPKVLGQQK